MGQRIDKEEILARTNRGLDIFRHYLGENLSIHRNFQNPFYQDSNPSCHVFLNQRANIYGFHDHGNPSYSGDCFWFVGQLFGLDYRRDLGRILAQISHDMGLGLSEGHTPMPSVAARQVPPAAPGPAAGPAVPRRSSLPYRVETMPFSGEALAFWQQYGIGADVLSRYGVVNVARYESVSHSGRAFRIIPREGMPVFGYRGEGHIKLYCPQRQMRFLHGGSRPQGHIFGVEQLPAQGASLFLTGGEKDVLSLAAHGIAAVSLNGETATLPRDFAARLGSRFRHFFVLYDADETGQREGAKRAAELRAQGLRARALTVPVPGGKGAKDVSDFFRLGGTREELGRHFLGEVRRGTTPHPASHGPPPPEKPRRGCRL